MNLFSSATAAPDPTAAYETLATVAGDAEALAAACKGLAPRALAEALKHAPAAAGGLFLIVGDYVSPPPAPSFPPALTEASSAGASARCTVHRTAPFVHEGR